MKNQHVIAIMIALVFLNISCAKSKVSTHVSLGQGDSISLEHLDGFTPEFLTYHLKISANKKVEFSGEITECSSRNCQRVSIGPFSGTVSNEQFQKIQDSLNSSRFLMLANEYSGEVSDCGHELIQLKMGSLNKGVSHSACAVGVPEEFLDLKALLHQLIDENGWLD